MRTDKEREIVEQREMRDRARAGFSRLRRFVEGESEGDLHNVNVSRHQLNANGRNAPQLPPYFGAPIESASVLPAEIGE